MRGILPWFLTLVSLAAASASQDPSPIPESVTRFWERLAKAKTVAYTVRYWVPERRPVAGRESVMSLLHTFEVHVKRPNLVAIRGTPPRESEWEENGQKRFDFFGLFDPILISDGKRAIRLNPVLRTYEFLPPVPALNKSDKGLARLLFTNYIFHSEPLKGMIVARTGGTVVMRLEDPRNKSYFEDWSFDGTTGGLTRISPSYRDPEGKVQEQLRYEFRHWDFNPPLPKSAFDTRPPRGYRP